MPRYKKVYIVVAADKEDGKVLIVEPFANLRAAQQLADSLERSGEWYVKIYHRDLLNRVR